MFNPWIGKIPWRRKGQLAPVFLPGKSHGQRSLVGYSPWGLRESDMTECTHTHKDDLHYRDCGGKLCRNQKGSLRLRNLYAPEPMLHNRRSHCNGETQAPQLEWPSFVTTRESPQRRPSTAKNKSYFKK